MNLFVQHTSCALSLNENWDEDVRADMSDSLDRIVPEDKKGTGLYRHEAEGSDDMPVSDIIFVIVAEKGEESGEVESGIGQVGIGDRAVG